MRFDALAALVKLAFVANGEECRSHWLAAQTQVVELTTARHNSHVSQLLQWVPASGDGSANIMQSAGMVDDHVVSCWRAA